MARVTNAKAGWTTVGKPDAGKLTPLPNSVAMTESAMTVVVRGI
jgi:hypothetical protein